MQWSFLWDCCWHSWPAIDLEMLYLLLLGPYSDFNTFLPCYSFAHFVGFIASQVVYPGLVKDWVYDVYSISGEWLGGEWSAGLPLRPWRPARCPPKPVSGAPLLLPLRGLELQQACCVPSGSAGGSSCLRVALGAPQRPVTMAPGRLRQLCVCERSECPDVSRCPDSSAIWALVLFRATQQPSVESLVNKRRPGWDILLTLNTCRIPSLGLYRSLFSQLHPTIFSEAITSPDIGGERGRPCPLPIGLLLLNSVGIKS